MLVAAMLLSSGSLFANDFKRTDPATVIQNEVYELLDGGFVKSTHKTLEASILLTINKQNEIVVLSVETKSKRLELFVKQMLNYHKINSDHIVWGRRYTVPLKVES